MNGIQAVVHDSVVTYAEVEIMTLPAEEVLADEYRTQPEVYSRSYPTPGMTASSSCWSGS